MNKVNKNAANLQNLEFRTMRYRDADAEVFRPICRCRILMLRVW